MPLSNSDPIYDGTLSEVLSLTPADGTRASATDIPGVSLEFMRTTKHPNGAWFGDCGNHADQTTVAAMQTKYLAVGNKITIAGVPSVYRGPGVGWVIPYGRHDALGLNKIRPTALMPSGVPTFSVGTTTVLTKLYDVKTYGATLFCVNQPFSFETLNGIEQGVQRTVTTGSLGSKSSNYTSVEFGSDAASLAFYGLGSASIYYRLSVYNESTSSWEYAQQWVAFPSYNNFKVVVTFAERRRRRMRWELSGGAAFVGVYVDASASMWKIGVDKRVAFVVGDSYSSGFDGFAPAFLDLLGFDLRVPGGVGSTGFLNNATTKTTYRDRISDVIDAKPEVIFVTGGQNDTGYSASAITAEVTTYLDALKTALPTAHIIVISSWTPPSNPSGETAVGNAVIAGAIASGIPYVDATNNPWFYGTGSTNTPDGTGNADFYFTSSDRVHPTVANGYPYLSNRAANAIIDLNP